ncbi:MAG: BrxA/BrxB family bacilliredoxin [Crocinitomicaceae bacterium]
MYPPELVSPMQKDLTDVGFVELSAAAEVDAALTSTSGSTLVVVNSVCGCAAGSMRPGVIQSLKNSKIPAHLVTVFAGVDVESTAQARKHFLPYPPSSPSIGFFKDGKLVHFIERHHIEGKSAEMIADHLSSVYDEYC